MKSPVFQLGFYNRSMLTDREIVFYVALGITVVLFELTIPSGLYVCIIFPLVIILITIGLWAFRADPNQDN